MTTLVWGAFVAALVPLVWLLYLVVTKGISPHLRGLPDHDCADPWAAGGGIDHALVGTVLVTPTAAIISVPIGVCTAIFLVEYGKRQPARAMDHVPGRRDDRHPVDRGRPLRALALRADPSGPAIRFGFGGAVALSLLMIPIVVRSTEEMLRLVPDDLREASYALGVPKWRTIVKVVLPTALGGIITGVTLAVARVIGETAPLLVICGLHQHREPQPVQRPDDDPAGLHLLLVHPAGRGPFNAPPGTEPPASPMPGGPPSSSSPGVAAQPGCSHHRQDLRRPEVAGKKG